MNDHGNRKSRVAPSGRTAAFVGAMALFAAPAAPSFATKPPPADDAAAPKTPESAQPGTVPRESRARLQQEHQAHLPAPAPTGPSDAAEDQQAEVPAQLRTQVLAEAAQHAGTAAASATVLSSQAVTWPDGSLGCPQRGVDYPQLPVSGYRVVVSVGGETYDYRVTPNGQMRLCTGDSGVRAGRTSPTPPQAAPKL